MTQPVLSRAGASPSQQPQPQPVSAVPPGEPIPSAPTSAVPAPVPAPEPEPPALAQPAVALPTLVRLGGLPVRAVPETSAAVIGTLDYLRRLDEVLDGAADLMHYPDRFTPVSAAADLTCLSDLTTDPAAPTTQGGPAGTIPPDARPATLTRAELVSRVEAAAGTAGAESRSTSRAVLVRCPGTAQALQEVLVAWRTGRTAVLLTPEAGDDVAAAAIRQEGIVE